VNIRVNALARRRGAHRGPQQQRDGTVPAAWLSLFTATPTHHRDQTHSGDWYDLYFVMTMIAWCGEAR